mmetsp:Transcript_34113/g.90995  ORF Transcript_34113/g.90995 Transcript_34113/m.90995 type:complete len:344 (-) Transcript_34113:99-1130(-)
MSLKRLPIQCLHFALCAASWQSHLHESCRNTGQYLLGNRLFISPGRRALRASRCVHEGVGKLLCLVLRQFQLCVSELNRSSFHELQLPSPFLLLSIKTRAHTLPICRLIRIALLLLSLDTHGGSWRRRSLALPTSIPKGLVRLSQAPEDALLDLGDLLCAFAHGKILLLQCLSCHPFRSQFQFIHVTRQRQSWIERPRLGGLRQAVGLIEVGFGSLRRDLVSVQRCPENWLSWRGQPHVGVLVRVYANVFVRRLWLSPLCCHTDGRLTRSSAFVLHRFPGDVVVGIDAHLERYGGVAHAGRARSDRGLQRVTSFIVRVIDADGTLSHAAAQHAHARAESRSTR